MPFLPDTGCIHGSCIENRHVISLTAKAFHVQLSLSFPMQIIHKEHEGENATWETETWMEEPEQIDFKESEECGPELFVSG